MSIWTVTSQKEKLMDDYTTEVVKFSRARLSLSRQVDPETGEILPVIVPENPPHGATEKSRSAPYLGILPNYQPLCDSERVIQRFYLQAQARALLPDERVAKCLRLLRPTSELVDVLYAPAVKKAHYKGLITCGRVWFCPVCAAKITERRREELTAALAKTSYTPVMVTFTLRHKSTDSLESLLKALLSGFEAFSRDRAGKRLKSRFRWVGYIKALEVTHGAAGWHPHLHVLYLLEQQPDVEAMASSLKAHWLEVLQKRKFDASWAHGLDVRTGNSAVKDYIAKYGRAPVKVSWTLEHELTKSPVKVAHDGGRSPFQLLADFGAGDQVAGDLFVEYAKAFKGKRQLIWSRGLRALLLGDVPELTDEAIADESRESSDLLASLSKSEWQRVLRADLRGELLAVASAGDAAQLWAWLLGAGVVSNFVTPS